MTFGIFASLQSPISLSKVAAFRLNWLGRHLDSLYRRDSQIWNLIAVRKDLTISLPNRFSRVYEVSLASRYFF